MGGAIKHDSTSQLLPRVIALPICSNIIYLKLKINKKELN